MILTDKCKQEFEKWYINWIFLNKTFLSLRFSNDQILENFKSMHGSEKFGVYQDYFDDVEIDVLCRNKDGRFISFSSPYSKTNSWHVEEHDTRQEARQEAIKKANELRNKQLKGG